MRHSRHDRACPGHRRLSCLTAAMLTPEVVDGRPSPAMTMLVPERPDDLGAQMVRAALAKVPELDPHDIDDLMLGCSEPAGTSGYNLARVVSVLAGFDHLPGPRSTATAPRACRPAGWRCTRSRPARETCSSPPGSRRAARPQGHRRRHAGHPQRRLRRRGGQDRRPRPGRLRLVRSARRRRAARHLHHDGPDGREPGAS